MDRRTVIPCYSTHHTQACRYRGLWTDGQSYLAIAHTTLRPADIEGCGYMPFLPPKPWHMKCFEGFMANITHVSAPIRSSVRL